MAIVNCAALRAGPALATGAPAISASATTTGGPTIQGGGVRRTTQAAAAAKASARVNS
ncbi:hypothetical protein [Xylophilus ampelinus]|uniref:hypothetical protein n=1 Tax=Xylophilus ampelinus TaxID=54067 RepID=UPI001314C122|nr:hypothetical protein [Xylophilus ampelinus]MCS4511400.1 hypothetical protein [Xylophilus ampelinus]